MSTQRTARCETLVFDDRSYGGHHCTKKVFKDGFCKMHQPEAVKARSDKTKAKWQQGLEAMTQRTAAARLAEFHARHFDAMEKALQQFVEGVELEVTFFASPGGTYEKASTVLAAIAADRSNLK